MPVWFAKSRAISHHLNRKVGFMGILHQNFWTSSCSRHPSSLSSIFIPAGIHEDHPTPHVFPFNSSITTRFSLQRFKSTKAASQLEQLYSTDDDDHDTSQALDFPGGKVTYTPEMRFLSESNGKRVPCYRVLDDNGEIIIGSDYEQLSEEVAVKIYSNMVSLQMMDTVFYEAQRQGRISFYLTSTGEEAINIASAAALSADDIILPQYREPGILLWRGFTIQEFANQCFGNKDDYGKGRQMPIHYGSKKHNFVTVSSPIATQLPQAVGIAYSLKMDKKDSCVVTYTGDGGTSEGDFHAALNFAAVTEAPVVFICRNNGWAISTHISEQFRSDGIVVRGRAYGIRSIRVDGNDALAVYSAIHEAREMAISKQRPVLVEVRLNFIVGFSCQHPRHGSLLKLTIAKTPFYIILKINKHVNLQALSYRVGHHSTSDDSTKYRPVDEIDYWKKERNPVNRFRKWVERNGWWSEEKESELRSSIKKQLLQVIQVAEKTEKPPLKYLFSDVYDIPPPNLCEQEKQLRETIYAHPQDYPSDVPL